MNDPGSLSFSMAMAGGAEQTDVAGNMGVRPRGRPLLQGGWAGAPGVPAPRQLSAPGMGSVTTGVSWGPLPWDPTSPLALQ